MDLTLHWSGDWPEHVAPLLEALQSLPDIEHAPDGTVVLCPDALAFSPPPAPEPLVAIVPDASALVDPGRREASIAAVSAWAGAGAALVTPTEYGARLLRSFSGARDVDVIALPLPAARAPQAWPRGADIVALHVGAYGPALGAAGPLRLAGLEPTLVLAGGGADAFMNPGGPSQRFGLLGGQDVVAVSDPAELSQRTGVIMLGEEGSGIGWMLRQALATGRPVVAPSSWLNRDHLSAIGTSAYLHDGRPDSIVDALAAALREARGSALGAAARAAVLSESFADAARALLDVLSRSLAPLPSASSMLSRPVARSGDGLAVDFVNLHSSGGGGERFMRSLAAAMGRHRSRPRVRVVCRVEPDAAFDLGADELASAGVDVVAVTGADDPESAIAAEMRGADVVYCSWPQLAEPPETDAPLVCTYHDLNFKHFDVYGPDHKQLLERQMPRWIERCRAIVHSSKFIETEMHRFFDVPDGLTHVIPLTAERSAGEAGAEARAAVRARHGLGDGPFLLSPNGNHLHKNYAGLGGALRRLRAGGRPVRVVATGAGTERFHGPDLIGLGYVSSADVAALYAECAGVVQTTLYEAGSFPMIEAMAMRRPVAISAIASVLEQTERLGLVAETFDPCDVEDLGEAVWRLWSGSVATRPEALEANARAVLARTWDDVAGDYLALLGAVAAGSPVPALA